MRAHTLARLPLLLSVLFHAGVIGVVSFVSNLPPSVEIRNDAVPALRVQLIKAPGPPPPENPPDPALVESTEDLRPAMLVNDPAPDSLPAEPEDEPPTPLDDVPMPGTVAGSNQTSGDAPRTDLSGEQLQASMKAYISSYRSSIQQSWVEECIKYQNRHGVQDCTTGNDTSYSANATEQEQVARLFENYVARKTDNQRYSRQLLAESEYLREIMDDNPVLGSLAQQRYALVKARYCQINGCTGPSFASISGDVVVIINLVSLVLRVAGMEAVPAGLNMAEGQNELQQTTPSGEKFSTFGAGNAEDPLETDTFRITPPLFPLR